MPSAIVMGGSLGGLTAGLVLADLGWEVDVFERSARPLESSGAGIVLHEATIRPLLAQGWEVEDIGSSATTLRYMGADGESVHEQGCWYRFSSYSWLHRQMLVGFDERHYHLGREVVDFRQTGDRVQVDLADGSMAEADLLVCADGIHSTARARLLPDVRHVYAGYVGWRGTVSESVLSERTFRQFDEAVIYHVMPNSHILTYPIPTTEGALEPGQRLTNWVWYRNVSEGAPLDALLTDRRGQRHEISLGPGAVRDEPVAELRAAAEAALPPPLAEIVLQTEKPFVQVVFDVEVPRMVFGRICLIGDAAFIVRPHLAVGTAKAAEDAWTLGEQLAATDRIEEALRRWEPGRLALGTAAIARATEVGRSSQFDSTWRVGDPLPYGLHEAGDSALPPTADYHRGGVRDGR